MRETTEQLLSARRVIPVFVDTGIIQLCSNKVQLWNKSLAATVQHNAAAQTAVYYHAQQCCACLLNVAQEKHASPSPGYLV